MPRRRHPLRRVLKWLGLSEFDQPYCTCPLEGPALTCACPGHRAVAMYLLHADWSDSARWEVSEVTRRWDYAQDVAVQLSAA